MKRLILFFLIAVSLNIFAQTELVFVYFKDKPNKASFYQQPLTELSQKSLDRRSRLGISLNDQDAPIEPSYIAAVRDLGFTVKDQSKWMNGVAVQATASQISQLAALSFVQAVESFIKHPGAVPVRKKTNKFDEFNRTAGKTEFNYGQGLEQINQVNLRPLHVAGFTGAGMTIAVLDTGFPYVNTGSAYERLRSRGQIKGGYNFINKSTNIYSTSLNNHGSYCLGVIGGYIQNGFAGSAPDADFYLYATEDAANEIPEEQLYWAQAAEEADRVGADVITSSLGYYDFDDPRYNLVFADMNGTTSFIARSAQIAVEKGIFVVTAAGNEGTNAWKRIVTPGDNEKVFTIGSVTSTGSSSSFSSYGPNANGSIKPDASARGSNTAIAYNNSVTYGSGTSFATPLAAGGIACLIQAFPDKPLQDLQNTLRQTASLYPNTNAQQGYGILNFEKARQQSQLNVSELQTAKIQLYPNPVDHTFGVKTAEKIKGIELYNTLGQRIKTFEPADEYKVNDLPAGIYFLKISTASQTVIEKMVKK